MVRRQSEPPHLSPPRARLGNKSGDVTVVAEIRPGLRIRAPFRVIH